MEFHEFGKADGPVILCMHGMMQPWDTIYQVMKPLEKDFRLVIPALEGFYPGSGIFTSFQQEAGILADYVKKNQGGRLRGAYGISQGALLLTEVLTQNRIRIDTVVLDGTYVAHQGKISGLVTYLLLRYFKYHRNHPPKLLGIGLSLMGIERSKQENAMDALRRGLYWDAEDESIRRNCLENYTYHVKEDLGSTKAEVILWCGEKEKYALKSHEILKKYIVPAEETVFKGLGHGEFMARSEDRMREKLRAAFMAR